MNFPFVFSQLIAASVLWRYSFFENTCWSLNTRLSRKSWFTVSHIDILWQSCVNHPGTCSGLRTNHRCQTRIAKVYGLWCVPRGLFQEPQPKYLCHKATRASKTIPLSLIAHFFPGLAIIYLTLSRHGLSTARQMVWSKTTEKNNNKNNIFISLNCMNWVLQT